MADERLSASMFESLLTALAYAPQAAIAPILGYLEPDMFEGAYGDLADRIFEYRLRYKEPPAPAHLDDIFDHVLSDTSHKKYAQYNRIMIGMRETAPSLNIKFLCDRVVDFARSQRLKEGVLRAAERYQQGGDNTADEVEGILNDTLRQRVRTVSYGERLSDDPFDFIRNPEVEDNKQVKLGIDVLDRFGLVPTLGELWYFLAPRKRGKSWALQFAAYQAALQGWPVVYISLENRRTKVKARFMQMIFAAAKRNDQFITANLKVDEKKILEEVSYNVMKPGVVYTEPAGFAYMQRVSKRMMHQRALTNITIEEFPSGSLSVQGLDNWLDGLEGEKGIVPLMVALDYPQLMQLDERDLRGSYGRLTIALRGLAAKRNFALVAAMQGNRSSETAGTVTSSHAAEDISQINTADTVITYNQTDMERQLGLARLFVAAARNDMDRFSVLISQAYTTGQFQLASARMPQQKLYQEILEAQALAASRERLGNVEKEAA